MRSYRHIDDSREELRRDYRTRILKAGWPSADAYSAGLQYNDKIQANTIYDRFLFQITDLAIDEEFFSIETLEKLGPCAAKSVPRAMYLIGMVDSDEGGAFVKLPKNWPCLSVEPERRDINGDKMERLQP